MHARRLAFALVVATTVMLSGCFGTPAPVETTPGFAREEEAFAAAEQTYRDYVDALNQVDLSNPETFEPVFALTTGDFQASERKNLTNMSADGWRVEGESRVTATHPRTYQAEQSLAVITVCVDVSAVQLFDSSGRSVVATDRPPTQVLDVSVTAATQSTHLIAEAAGSSDTDLC